MARYRIFGIARDNDNNPVVGGTASLRRESDNVELDSTTTGSDGSYGWLEEEINYPGAVKVRITAPDGVVREVSGRATGQTGTFFIPDLMRAFRMMTDGVVSGVDGELEVSADGGGMNIDVASGFAFAFGHPFYWPEEQEVSITSNGTGNPRIDLIILRMYPPGTLTEGLADITVVQGTPAASPTAPGVTQDPDVVWEIPLGTVAVAAGAATITGGNVTDAREYTSGPLMDSSVTSAKLADLAVITAKLADEAVTVAKMTSEAQVSTAAIAKVLKASTTADSPPAYAQISLSELADVSETAPTSGQVPRWNATDGKYEPHTPAALTLVIQEGDVTVVTAATTLDFTASPFAVTESPTGEANIALTFGTGAGEVAEGNHVHVPAAITGLEEQVQDWVGTYLVEGTNIDLTYNDAANILTISATAAGITVKDGGTSVDTDITTIDFSTGFTVTETPENEVNVFIDEAAVSMAGHTHAYASDSHVHDPGDSVAGKATKSYASTSVTSTAADGVEIAGFDVDIPAGGSTVLATGHAQASAPSSGGTYIELGVKIGSASAEWGMRTQTVGGERGLHASSTRVYPGGASSQRISLRARVDSGTGASINAAHVNCYGAVRVDAPS